MNDVPHIFDSELRRLRRARAARTFCDFSFLADEAAGEIGERLSATPLKFERAVFCGGVSAPAVQNIDWLRGDAARALRPDVVFDEEASPFAERSLDLYVSVMTLHAANDLPGALAQIRRALKPGGLFMAALFGGQTLFELREALAEAEIEVDGGLSPRVAPFVDVKDAGALLQRAGFAQPVADVDTITVWYQQPLKLLADLRGMGETNVLVERRRRFLKRGLLMRACEAYSGKRKGPDGRVPATFDVLYLTGWAG